MSSRRSCGETLSPPRCYCKVVQEKEPFSIETPPKNDEDELLEVLRAVRGAKGQPSRKITPAGGYDRHFPKSLLLILALIESFLQIPDADILTPSYQCLDPIGIWDYEIGADINLKIYFIKKKLSRSF